MESMAYWADVDLKANELKGSSTRRSISKDRQAQVRSWRTQVPFGPYLSNTLREWKLACPHERTGQRCKAPAVRGWSVCRFHGARGGAPKGKANGAWKHGYYGGAAKAERLLVRLLLKDASILRKLLSKGET